MQQPALKKFYLETIAPDLMKSRKYKNKHQVPVVEKIVINSAINASADKKWIDEVLNDIASITCQRPVITKAKDSISNFKVRKGMPLGVKVTLRGPRMYDFLLRLIAVALPSIRDFRGISRKFDGGGNYTVGIADHSIFPEIRVDSNRANIGMDITIVTSAKTDEEGRQLLEAFGMPFRK
jgi:large subunit ribosomal protein L5